MRELQTKMLEPEDTVALMKSITPERIQQEFEETGSGDFGFAYGDKARFRVSIFKQKGVLPAWCCGGSPTQLLTFEQIGLPKMAEQICRRPRGIFLVTGPTGSGKTTTLASMINYINENFERHIITMEEPIEYYHKHKKSIVVQREIGVDVPSFSEALRRALRQDPDVMLVGEMRDLATISAAITAAETGHLVFGTLHTSGAASTINRIIDAFPTDQQEQVRVQLAGNLIAVLSQACARASTPTGMLAAYEFMYVTPGIQNLIRENKSFRIDSRNPDRQAVRDAAAGRQPVDALHGRPDQRRGGDRQEQEPRRRWSTRWRRPGCIVKKTDDVLDPTATSAAGGRPAAGRARPAGARRPPGGAAGGASRGRAAGPRRRQPRRMQRWRARSKHRYAASPRPSRRLGTRRAELEAEQPNDGND